MKTQQIVLDTSPFVQQQLGLLQELSQQAEFYTIPDVLEEVHDSKSKEFINALPFELRLIQPTQQALQEGKVLNLTFSD